MYMQVRALAGLVKCYHADKMCVVCFDLLQDETEKCEKCKMYKVPLEKTARSLRCYIIREWESIHQQMPLNTFEIQRFKTFQTGGLTNKNWMQSNINIKKRIWGAEIHPSMVTGGDIQGFMKAMLVFCYRRPDDFPLGQSYVSFCLSCAVHLTSQTKAMEDSHGLPSQTN